MVRRQAAPRRAAGVGPRVLTGVAVADDAAGVDAGLSGAFVDLDGRGFGGLHARLARHADQLTAEVELKLVGLGRRHRRRPALLSKIHKGRQHDADDDDEADRTDPGILFWRRGKGVFGHGRGVPKFARSSKCLRRRALDDEWHGERRAIALLVTRETPRVEGRRLRWPAHRRRR